MKWIVVLMAVTLMGCSTKYDTVDGKDISVRVRSIWADVDYDSRRCEPLPPLDSDGLEPLE
jgi:hypothetical protein